MYYYHLILYIRFYLYSLSDYSNINIFEFFLFIEELEK